MLRESNPSQSIAAEREAKNGAVAIKQQSSHGVQTELNAMSKAAAQSDAASHSDIINNPATEVGPAPAGKPSTGPQTGKRWWWIAAASALLLTALTASGVYLVTKKPSTVDSFVILTVPSGAEINLDSRDYGNSPVKLEQLAIGTYTLTITKEGYEPIVRVITVSETESGPLEFKLKPVLPSDAVNLSRDEQIKQFQQHAEEAFARWYYGPPYDGSALQYAELIQRVDSTNSFAEDMRQRVRKAAHQSAQSAISRGDLAHAQETYAFLAEYFPEDEDVRAGIARVENLLAARRGEVRELVRKADEALQAGNLTAPARASAYYYSRQALAIDRQNERARQIHSQVRETLASVGEQAFTRGDAEGAIKQLEEVAQLFPEDKRVRARLRELQTKGASETVKVPDANERRLRGLDLFRKGDFAEAIPELQYAAFNGKGGPEVIFSLAYSFMRTGQLDQAETYFKQVPQNSDDAYRSSIAALGDIAYQRGNTARAIERYKEAQSLGGSTIYSIPALEDKIERIERRQRERAAEPTPVTIRVKHAHGGLLGGSCSGTLTCNSTGVRYDGSEHTYSYTLSGVSVRISKDEMSVLFQRDAEKFKVPRAEAERFRETISRYQTYSPKN